MTDRLEELSEEERGQVKAAQGDQAKSPMLATLTHDYFSDPDWLFERKFDGERLLARRAGAKTELLTRNGKEVSDTYPEIAAAIAAQPCRDFVIDGEVVAFDGKVTSFARLQQRMQIRKRAEAEASRVAVYFYAFDILRLDGKTVEDLPLRRRKTLLKKALQFEHPLRFTPHRNEDGEAYHQEACRKGWEGIIAKRAAAPYRHSRSRDWLKFKCAAGQELVIGGFTEPQGSRLGFGALLVGYYKDGELRYAGKVGTGFDDDFLKRFRKRLDKLRRKTSPFAEEVGESEAHWVAPKLIGEFGFTEWTRDGKLRHPRFLGLRRDKAAKDVVREDTAD
jgi:bifunctional non-homologous end joining protein LigD